MVAYVNRLHAQGLYAEVTLMWAAPGTQKAQGHPAILDQDHAPAARRAIATAFKGDPNTFIGLPSAPRGIGWACWRDGGAACSVGYPALGMQAALDAIRSTGATNVVTASGIDYANNLSQWLAYRPSDPAGQLIAEAHVYGKNVCSSASCFDSQYAPVANAVPLIYGETGETYDDSDCGSGYISSIMGWADAHGVDGYEAWVWNTWGTCGSLISSYSGTPANAYGSWVRAHYLTLPGPGAPLRPVPAGGSTGRGAVRATLGPIRYKVLSGRIYRRRSGLWRLWATDGHRLEVKAARRHRRFVATVKATGTVPRAWLAGLRRLAIAHVGSANRRRATLGIRVYDWRGHRWHRLARRRATRRDRRLHWAWTANPRRLTSRRGHVLVRVTLKARRRCRLRIDSIHFAVTSRR